jgi:hypothetical protein
MSGDRDDRDRADDDDSFRPRIGSRRQPRAERVPTFLGAIARAVAKQGGRKRGSGRAASKRGRIAVRAPHELSRRCVVKARYVPMTGNGRKLAKAHLAYLERDGVERDGSLGVLYSVDASFDTEAFRAPVAGEPRQFRFIVSPEDANLMDLTEFTRQFMRQVEKDVGRSLDWAAVNHHNTDNPHVHIVVRGLDRAGDEVRIDGRYIAREMRWRAQEIATRELGPRNEIEFSRARNAQVERPRYTELDREIETLAGDKSTISLPQILALPGSEGARCIARLRFLEEVQLAKVEHSGGWKLVDGWTKSLQDRSEYQDVLDRLRPLVGDRAAEFQIVDERAAAISFEGRALGKGLDDELGGRMFAAVRTPDGRNFYVRLAPEIGESVRDGDALRVQLEVERWVKPADKIVARFAEGNGGLYDPSRHRRELESLDRVGSDVGAPTPEQRVAANIRRLERLERYQLVKRHSDGRWQIPADLMARLEERERTYPQQRMRVERIDRDRVPAPAPRDSASRNAEVSRLAQAVGKELGLAYVADPMAFRGRVTDCRAFSRGGEYALVVDYQRGEFTVIPKPADWERLNGRTVQLSRDRDRKLVIQLDRGLSR